MKFAILCVLSLLSFHANACFILFLSDGRQVLIGNHEDYFDKDAAIKVNAPSAGKYGSVIFTFMHEGWAQGGMNEHGLFFDAASTPFQEILSDPKSDKFKGYIWQHMLDKARNVKEAFQLLSPFERDLNHDLRESNVIIADAEGNVGWIGVKDGKVTFEELHRSQVVQTNFNPKHPEMSTDSVCWRYQKAMLHLSSESQASLENVKSILEGTHQDELTVYSNIYDLKNRIIHTFNKRDFQKDIEVQLPDVFKFGNCMLSLDSLANGTYSWDRCSPAKESVMVKGKVLDEETGQPIPFANIGLLNKNVGTLTDPDGSYVLELPCEFANVPVFFSAIGYRRRSLLPSELTQKEIKLKPESKLLSPVTIEAKKLKSKRMGWMGGRDGILPLDTVQGGGAVALLVESPATPSYVDKLQVRLMYNSKDTLKLRFHIYAYDTILELPGEELLTQEIILQETKRYGWLRFDLSKYDIRITDKLFVIAFEWLDDQHTRETMVRGLREWERWKKQQWEKGNKKIVLNFSNYRNGIGAVGYEYHGNMMDWPGFKNLPPFTGLMIEKDFTKTDARYPTFERKTSFGQWKVVYSTLNAVITVKY